MLNAVQDNQEHFYSSIIHVFDEGVNKGKSTRYECLVLSAKVTTHKHTQIHNFSDVCNFFSPLTLYLWINRREQRTMLPWFEECKYLLPGFEAFFLSPISLSRLVPLSYRYTHTNTCAHANTQALRKLGQTVKPWIRGSTFLFVYYLALWNFQHIHLCTRICMYLQTHTHTHLYIHANQPSSLQFPSSSPTVKVLSLFKPTFGWTYASLFSHVLCIHSEIIDGDNNNNVILYRNLSHYLQ